MPVGFMFQISNQCPFPVTFTSSDYEGTGDISPFNVTVGPNDTAPGASQNPGYYYFEIEQEPESSVPTRASFTVIATPAGNAPGDGAMFIPTMQDEVMSSLNGPVSYYTIYPYNGSITYQGGTFTAGVTQGGTVGKDNWTVGLITATYVG